ncbi:MAG: hypothetical protein E8D42_07810 [Nitrospira sp.]|nr:MAG: hypothetical protein E8D42_07810 [Nitrospira sp.]
MNRLSWMLSAALLFLSVYSCSGQPVRTISTGSHIPYTAEEIRTDQPQKFRFVVWSNHSGATQAAIQFLQKTHNIVVERARLQEIFGEQRVQLSHSSEDEAKVLRVGRLAGAERVVFVEVVKSDQWTGDGYSRIMVYRVSVNVRCIDVETAEIQWSGTAHFDQPIIDPEESIPLLTKVAMSRATCPIERGYKWTEVGTVSERPGCNRDK